MLVKGVPEGIQFVDLMQAVADIEQQLFSVAMGIVILRVGPPLPNDPTSPNL